MHELLDLRRALRVRGDRHRLSQRAGARTLRFAAPPGTVARVVGELDGLDAWASALVHRAEHRGVFLIARAQARSVRRVVVHDGKIEATSSASMTGCGIQVVDPAGRSVLASHDDLAAEPALGLVDRLVELLSGAERLGLERGAWPVLAPLRDRRVPGDPSAFERIDLGAIGRRLLELEREIAGRVPDTSVQLSYRAELDAWRIVRSDGTDVVFAMPRCSLAARLTAGPRARGTPSRRRCSQRSRPRPTTIPPCGCSCGGRRSRAGWRTRCPTPRRTRRERFRS